MNTLATFKQRLTASIAILAVLLLFVAPVVSENLAEHHDRMIEPAASAMSAAMPMMDHHNSMAMSDHSMMMDQGFACGYCDLLIHVPLMLWRATPLIGLMSFASRAPPVRYVAHPQPRRITRLYRPRAPPASAPGLTPD